MLVFEIIFLISLILIFWANIGYPISIFALGKLIKRKNLKKYDYYPTVTILIVAHNEEKVIKQKLENVIKIDYPKDKIDIMVASDNSTDETNNIVNDFINKNRKHKIKLFKVNERKGKTNAQNEAVRVIKSEIIVFTDANAMLKENSVKELVASFYDNSISYVTGLLTYINTDVSATSYSENVYWSFDTKIRDIESRIQSVTAGNGALYACRRNDYYEFDPICCHDSAMPTYYAQIGKRAISNHQAIAYEKAGESNQDEFKRKVRMNRNSTETILKNLKILNPFKYKWYSYCYFGHRVCRHLLWLFHILLIIANIIIFNESIIFKIGLFMQAFIYFIAISRLIFQIKNKFFNLPYYYCMTVAAQIVGVWNELTGKSKPFWEKAESTR